MKKLLFLFFLISLNLFSNDSLEKVTLKLNWKYQFQFAGFIAAKEKGFYKEAGLDVEFLEKEGQEDFIKGLVEKKYDYLVSGSRVFFHENINDIKFIANYFKQSPLAVVAQKEYLTFNSLRDKYMMLTEYAVNMSAISLIFDKYKMNIDDVKLAPLKYDINDFINGRLDATTVYTSDQLYYLDKIGMNYNLFSPANYGFNTPEMNLLTSVETYNKHKKRTLKFIEATNKGWRYALENKNEIISIIYDKYSKRKSIASLKYESKRIDELFLKDMFSIGEVNMNYYQSYFNYLYEKKHLKVNFKKLVHKSNKLELSDKEKKWVDTVKTLKLIVSENSEPFSFYKDGEYKGLLVDYAKELAKLLNMKLELVKQTNTNDNLEANLIDLQSVVIQSTKRKDLESLKEKHKKVTDNYYFNRGYENIEVNKNVKDVFKKLKNQEVDFFITNELTKKYWFRTLQANTFLENKELGNETVPYSIVFSNSSSIYSQSALEKAIDFIDKDMKRSIYLKWSLHDKSVFDYSLIYKLSLVVFFIIAVILYFNYKLKKKVDERTYEIKDLLVTMEEKVIERTKNLEEMKNEKEKLLEKTMDSIKYASFVQNSIIPKEVLVQSLFDDAFVLWEPRDIVGGDIYFVEEFNNGDEVLVFIIDCVGHGVHGALITTLVRAVQRRITDKYIKKNLQISPKKILEEFDVLLLEEVQHDNENISDIGFDGGILYYNKNENRISYAGANTPLIYVQDSKVEISPYTKRSIGNTSRKKVIEEQSLDITGDTYLYLTTDGYYDQIGGQEGFPYGKRALINNIEKYHLFDLKEQKKLFLESLNDYAIKKDRNDDLCMIGMKIKKFRD